MRIPLTILTLFFYLYLVSPSTAQQSTVPAFPGAEGFGKYTTGGRGGKVYIVTNLNDKGPGSLREALEAREKRIVVFEISGNIQLQSIINVRHGNLTIAGQTAPGEGITIQNFPIRILNQENMIFRFLRFRLGDLFGFENDALEIRGGGDLIIDHCSFSWGTDETCSVYQIENTTIQNSIIAEGLNYSIHDKGSHGYGSIWGGTNVSFYKNLMAHFVIRSPSISTYSNIADFRNNVIYNWSYRAVNNGRESKANLIGNYFKPGPATLKADETHVKNNFLFPTGSPYGKFYLEGNKLIGRPEIDKDQWLGVRLENNSNQKNFLETCKNKDEKGNLTPFEIPENLYNNISMTSEESYEFVLKHAGASLFRDAVDQRIINETKTGSTTYKGSKTGLLGIIDSQKDAGGWPQLKSLPAPKDTDRDGMPDEWELANGLNPNKADDSLYTLSKEYTNIEVYINSLVSHIAFEDKTSEISVSGISVSPNSQTLEIGKSIQIKATLSPSSATNKSIIWSSSNAAIAKVNANGQVTGSSVGEAQITAKTQDGGFTATSKITVIESQNPLSIESFTVVDAYDDSDFFELYDGIRIESDMIAGLELNFRANTQPATVGSVAMSITGPIGHNIVENVAPYALFGDRNGDYSGRELPIGNYTISATPYTESNTNGTKGSTTEIRFSVVEPEKLSSPGKPVLLTPIDKSKDHTIPIEFQWEPLKNVDYYRIQISEKPDFSTTYIDENDLENNQFLSVDLNSGIQYYWRVRASNAAGNGIWSETWTFTTKETLKAPTPPSLLGPYNNSTGLTGTINLNWSKSENAEVYRIQIAKDVDFVRKQFDLYNIPTESFNINNLEAGETFYWRVNASNEAGNSGFSETWKFETLKGPDVPILHSPSDGKSDLGTEVKLDWENVVGADSYRLQLSESRDFSQRTVDNGNISESQLVVQNLAEGKTYFWRVRSSNRAGNSTYSETWSFETKTSLAIPTAPLLISPIQSSSVNSKSLEFEWQKVNTAEKYQIQVSKFSNFSQAIVYNNNNITNQKITVSDLEPDQVYFWRVRASNTTGNGPYSAVWLFRTDPLPSLDSPQLISPNDGSIIDQTSVEFTWSIVSDAKSYQLELSKDSVSWTNSMRLSDLEVNFLKVDNLERNVKYYWRVKAMGNRPESLSKSWGFEIAQDPEILRSMLSPVKIKAYPNPFKEILNLEFSKKIDGEVLINIIDNKGISAFEAKAFDIQETISLELPKDMPKGLYILKIQGFGFMESQKLIKN